ncbi:MAG: gliding motility-associated C-terminal domain-containing protein [Bacteroidia bacterium]|nr:gliding motility-associated C-terminal domain-containing protein [Bacteroidia bacterium]
MKLKFFIFVLLCSRLCGQVQVKAPELRCLEVMPNGDVLLTWIPPIDPNNLFTRYDIYSSIFAAGPFSFVSSSVSSINTNTFLHVGTSATSTPVYYYVTSVTGNSIAAASDTLKTISLNIFTSVGAQALPIQYNNVHNPKLGSTASTFTLNKQYPVGFWNTLAITPLLGYSDTISVCSASIAYQVWLQDNSGCISKSNTLGGVYHDSKQPNEPFVDSISVLPNGNTVISWIIPYDKDVVRYQIQNLKASGKRDTLAFVEGQNNTSYTYTSTLANNGPVSLYVGAIDSCSKASTLNYSLSSMYVTAKYDHCSYKTELSWNPYLSMPKGLREYRIYYSVDGGTYKQIGTTTLTTFTHPKADAGKNLCYFVRAVNKDISKPITASSNRYCFLASQVPSPKFVYVKNATVVDKSTCRVSVLIDTLAFCAGLDVLRSVDGINYTNIAFLPNNGKQDYSYDDNSTLTDIKSYYYKVVVRDSCGNARLESNAAKTILLKIHQEGNDEFTRQLEWSQYEGFSGALSAYEVYRVVNNVVQFPAVFSTNSLTTTFSDQVEDEASKGAKIEYYVLAREGAGNAYGLVSESKSNPASVYIEGELYVPNAFAPNGSNKTWLPVTHFVDKQEYLVRVFDRWGHVAFETRSDTEGWDGGNLASDVYVYLISYKNSRGEYKEAKGSVFLIR